jgi:putative NIF3 family GTP cyclohydrolase 1 type 2
MKAAEIVDRIRKNLGVAWRETTYRDTYKFGGPDTEVTGIATTVFVTLDVIERATAAGLNMIVPHEDTFWNDRDDVAVVSGDPLYKKKVDLLSKTNAVIFRMHDHMHAQRPDFTYVGSARLLGLDSTFETAPQSRCGRPKANRSPRAQGRRRSKRKSQPHPAGRRICHACCEQHRDRRRHQR